MRADGRCARMTRIAARPLVPGMAASITMTCGVSCAASAIASSPLLASPTTARSAIVLEQAAEAAPHQRVIVGEQHRDPVRHRRVCGCVCHRGTTSDTRVPPAGGRDHVDRAAHELGALAHGHQAQSARPARGRQAGSVVLDLEVTARRS